MARTISLQAVINWIRLKLQGSAPATPAAGYGYLYPKTSDKHLYWKDEAGVETDLMDITAASTTTVTNKNINLANNTVTGTTAEFNTALSDGNFATLAGSETLTNKTIAAPIITGAITLPDNVTQTFNPGADNAGLNVGALAGDPATPDNGDMWYDSTTNELTARINGANVNIGVGGVSFGTVAVSGQSDVVADAASDTLNLAAGTNVTITTTPGTDTVTIASSGGNAFGTIAVSGQSDVVADAAPDTLTIAAGTGISLTTTPGTDTVTIANTGGTFTLNTNTTPVGNVGTGEDDLITYSVAANTLSTNSQFVHFVMGGTFAASANNKRIRVKFGTTTLFDTGALAITAAGDWNVEGYIIRTGASAERCQVEFTSNETALAGSADYVDAVEDLTTSLTLKATGEATDNDDIIQKFLIVEKGGGSGAVTGPASSTDNAVARWDGTAGTVIQDSVITIGDTGAITFPDNIRQTFNPGADAAGINVGAIAGDPGTPSNGDLWYDSTTNELTARINGANVALGGSVATDTIWDAKGDLAGGTGSNTAARLAVGSNGQVLTADSAEATGMKWAASSGGLAFFGISAFTAPSSSGWTWDNQGSSTIDSAEGYEYMVAPKQSAVRISMRYRTPANTNWSIRVCGLYEISGTPDGSGGDSGFFIGWRDSAGKWVTFGTQIQGATGGVAFYSHKWTSATAYSAAYDSHTSHGIHRNPIWLRADYDGTNIVSYNSIDGKHWIQFYTTTLTNFLAAGTPNFGWGGYVNGSDNEIALLHYEEVALP